MRRIQSVIFIIIIALLMIGSGCSQQEITDGSSHDKKKITIKDKIFRNPIQLTTYANEVGFSLSSPEEQSFEAETLVKIEGKIDQIEDLNSEYIWILMIPEEEIGEIDRNDFNYYVPINDHNFSKELTLHHGAGEYEIKVRVPSNKSEEAGMYYDVATFTVMNQDEEIHREVEYTQYGVENQIQLTSPIIGVGESEGSIFIEGNVPASYNGDMVLVQVKKDNETRQLVFPTNDFKFEGDVPLYFGEGYHSIHIQTFNTEDELYYESAVFYVDNRSSTEFAEVIKYNEYISRGVSLYEPNLKQKARLSKQTYPIIGEIDQTIPGADDIDYLIITVNYLDEDLESSFLIPVADYKFDGLAYFRFGPGNYEVLISVPDLEKQDQSMFYYQGVAKVNHQVADIVDQRGLLPARGIESDDPIIIQQAEEIVVGLSNERDKAKAIFKFVAEHVAYDVEKAENDIFNIGDSALTTLKSGIGICQDYAFLAVALLRAIGMEAHFVEGDAGERHAWVEVKVDGEWLVMDPTWGAGYVQEGVFHFHYNEDYFDPDPSFLGETHSRDGIVY